MIVSLLDELVRRGGLRIALAGRNAQTLQVGDAVRCGAAMPARRLDRSLIRAVHRRPRQPLVHFLVKNIATPRYTERLIDVCDALLEIYAPLIGRNMHLDQLFVQLRRRIDTELALQRQLYEMLGAVDSLLAASTAR